MDTQRNPRQRNFVNGLIILGLMFVIFFGLRAARTFREFREHRPPPPFATNHIETDINLIRDWMTVPFIARMYHVKPRVLFEALEIPEQGNREKSLKQLNDEYYPLADGVVTEKVKAALLTVLADRQEQAPVIAETPTLP